MIVIKFTAVTLQVGWIILPDINNSALFPEGIGLKFCAEIIISFEEMEIFEFCSWIITSKE